MCRQRESQALTIASAKADAAFIESSDVPLRGNRQAPDTLKNTPKFWLRRQAESSIRVQEGEPISLAFSFFPASASSDCDGDCDVTPVASA